MDIAYTNIRYGITLINKKFIKNRYPIAKILKYNTIIMLKGIKKIMHFTNKYILIPFYFKNKILDT